MATVWTTAAENKLKRLRAEGYSYSTIAAMMGVTKGVLLGHVWRERQRSGVKVEQPRKVRATPKREAMAKRRLEAVTLTLVGYSNTKVAALIGVHPVQISKWRHDPIVRAKAEEIAAGLPKVLKPKKRKIARNLSPQERARRAEHMRSVSRRYWDEKRRVSA